MDFEASSGIERSLSPPVANTGSVGNAGPSSLAPTIGVEDFAALVPLRFVLDEVIHIYQLFSILDHPHFLLCRSII